MGNEKVRNQNQGSGEQPPIGQDSNPGTGQTGFQQEDTERVEDSEGTSPGTGGGEGSDPTAGLQGTGGSKDEGFIGQQKSDSDEYLQQSGNPESGFAEQGRGASKDSDIEGSSNS